MDMSSPGRAELRLFEGTILKAYQDSVGVWTIGTGHTAAAGDPKPKKGMTISALQADTILSGDLDRIYEPAVDRNVKVKLAQHEFDALVSFTYNLGEANLKKSTLLAKLNAGDRAGAGKAFLSWTKAGGKVLAGLVKRRQTESTIFLSGAYPGIAPAPSETAPEIKKVVTLAKGSKGAAVRELQTDLASLLFYKDKIDGDFGPKTDAAVRAFQRSAGLSDDGIAGIKTLAALDHDVAALPRAA